MVMISNKTFVLSNVLVILNELITHHFTGIL